MIIPTLISGLLTVAAILMGLPIAIVFAEILGGFFLPSKEPDRAETPPGTRIAVLVPAHNESSGVVPTLNDVRAQLADGDRLLVVADNCTDDTASVAAAAGAEVVARTDFNLVGKAYALDFGLSHLALNPPDIVIIVDADCRVAPGSVAALSKSCGRTGRPAQALDLMICLPGASRRQIFAEFAWRVKNWARPLGLHAAGFPCQLMGTGMAFPWRAIAPTRIHDDLVEDLRMGLDLAEAGYPPVFCPAALVTSHFPASAKAIDAQRQRWEHGHLRAILRVAPKTIFRAVTQQNVGLLALALDLLVPPLTLLVAVTGGLLGVTALAGLVGLSSFPLVVSTVNAVLLVAAILVAWLGYGRDILPLSTVGTSVQYAFAKFALYRDFFAGRAIKQWTRTDRGKTGSDDEQTP